MSEVPWYYKPVQHHGCRRAACHDYKRPAIYLITISKARDIPVWSHIVGQVGSLTDPPRVLHTANGQCIMDTLQAYAAECPFFGFPATVIMPDHLHIVWHVKEVLPRDVGFYIGKFKSLCTKNWKAATSQSPDCQLSLFADKFNDKIAFTRDIGERFVSYVLDNPRRRLMATSMPDYFTRRMGITIADRSFHVYGNFQLLKSPLISPVVISRRHSPDMRDRLRSQWNEIIRSGGVLVSPFISQAEREVMKQGLEGQASIIRIVPQGLYPKYKPKGLEFDLCSQGRLLHIGETRVVDAAFTLTRQYSLELNQLAYWIAERPADCLYLLTRR